MKTSLIDTSYCNKTVLIKPARYPSDGRNILFGSFLNYTLLNIKRFFLSDNAQTDLLIKNSFVAQKPPLSEHLAKPMIAIDDGIPVIEPPPPQWRHYTLDSTMNAPYKIVSKLKSKFMYQFSESSTVPIRASDKMRGNTLNPIRWAAAFVMMFAVMLASFARAQTFVDVVLKDSVDNSRPIIGGTINYYVTVKNNGMTAVSNVVVKNTFPTTGAALTNNSVSAGSFDAVAGSWVIPSIPAGGSVKLTLTGKVISDGVHFNISEIMSIAGSTTNNLAGDSGNGKLGEADMGTACFSVPILWEVGDEFIASLPLTGITNITWSKLSATGAKAITGIPSDSATVSNGVLTVTGTGRFAFTGSVNTCPATGCCEIIVIPAPVIVYDLALTKTLATTGDVKPGDVVTFNLKVKNQGMFPTSAISLSDSLPAGMTLADPLWTAAGQIATLNTPIAGPLAAGDSLSVTIKVKIDANFAGTTLTNFAQIKGFKDDKGNTVKDKDSTPGNGFNKGEDDDSKAPVTIKQTFDLALTKTLTSAGVVMPGDTATFKLEVENQGTVTAKNIVLSDSLPVGMTLADAAWTADATGRVATLNTAIAGPLVAGAKISINIKVKIDANFKGTTLTNFAQIKSTEDDKGNKNPTDIDSQPNSGFNKGQDDDSKAPIEIKDRPLGSIGNFVWIDANDNGIQDVGEVGVPGVKVFLWTNNGGKPGSIITSMLTGPNGEYLFSGLDKGEYFIQFDPLTLPDSLNLSNKPNTGSDDSDSDADPATGVTQLVSLDPIKGGILKDNLTLDAGVTLFNLGLNKTLVTTGAVKPGDVVTFKLTVTNKGSQTATAIALTDSLPAGMSLADPNWTSAGQIATLNVPIAGPLAPKATASVDIKVKIDATFTGTSLTNFAQIKDAKDDKGKPRKDVNSTPGNGFNNGEDDASKAPVTITQPGNFDLALAKTLVTTGAVKPGDVVTFKLTVTNEGDVAATKIALTDSLPAGMTLADANWTASGAIATLNVPIAGPLAPKATASVDIKVKIDANFTGTSLMNFAQIKDAKGPNGETVKDKDSTPGNGFNNGEDDASKAPVTITPDVPKVFDLSLAKTLVTTGAVKPGDIVTFKLTVTNEGDVAATKIALTDSLPAGMTLADANWTASGAIATLNVPIAGPLAPKATASVDIKVKIDATFTGTSLMNFAQIKDVKGPNGEIVKDKDSTPGNGFNNGEDDASKAPITITPDAPKVFDLSLAKTLVTTGAVKPGDIVTFKLTVTNEGDIAATKIALTDSLPAGMTLADANWTASGAIATLNVPIAGPLAPKATASVDIKVKIDATFTGTSLMNFAQIKDAKGPDGETVKDKDSTPGNGFNNGEDDGSKAPVSVGPCAIPPTPTCAGTVSNECPKVCVNLNDYIESEIRLTGSTFEWHSGSTPTAANLITDPSCVKVSGRYFLFEKAACGVYSNGALIEVKINECPKADLSLTKMVSNKTPKKDDNITYTIKVKNAGPATATNVEIMDKLPAGLFYVSGGAGLTETMGMITGKIASIAKGDSATFTYIAKVIGSGSITNYAEVTKSDQGDPDSTPGNNDNGIGKNEDDNDKATITVKENCDIPPTPTCGGTVSNVCPLLCVNLNEQIQSTIRTAGGKFEWHSGPIPTAANLIADPTCVKTSGKYFLFEVAGCGEYSNGALLEVSIKECAPQVADLSLTKTASKSAVMIGDSIKYTITVKNAGPDAATNVEISDKLPTGLSFISGGSGVTQTMGMITGKVASIAKGASATFTYMAKVTGAGSLKNMAEVSKSDQKDPNSTPGNASTKDEDDDDAITIESKDPNCAIPPTPTCGGPRVVNCPTDGCVNINLFIQSAIRTKGGIHEWHTGASPSSPIVADPTCVKTSGSYYVFEKAACGEYSNAALLMLTIEPCKSSLLASNDAATTPPGTKVNIPLLGNDKATDGTTATLTNVTLPVIVANPLNGTVTIKADGTADYTPNAGFSGTDTFTYKICDKIDGTKCSTATVTITVPAMPTPMLAANSDAASTPPGTKVNIPLLGNDKATDGTTATLTNVTLPVIVTNPTNGTVTIKADGTADYTPNAGFSGTDTFTYKICDRIDGTKCSTATVTITVPNAACDLKSLILACAKPDICPGESATITVTANGCEGGTVNWSTGATGNNIVVTPNITTGYTATCTKGGCVSPISNTITVSVANPSVPVVSASTTTVCANGTATLTASGCSGTVMWSNGVVGIQTTVAPTATTTYTAMCKIGTCMSANSAPVTITIGNPSAPTISASPKTLLCAGETVVLAATGCEGGSVVWSNGTVGTSITVAPMATTDYTAKCKIADCMSSASNNVKITVNTSGTAPIVTASKNSICNGESSILTATGCEGGTITWSNGATGNSITVSPTTSTTYQASCKGATGKCDGAPGSVTVSVGSNTQPVTIAASPSNSVCQGGTVTLTATGCSGGTVNWSNGATGNSITVTPTANTTYTATCKIGTCESTPATISVTVTPKPAQPLVTCSTENICPGESVTLEVKNCTGIVIWSTGATGVTAIAVTPTITTAYTAICKIGNCESDISKNYTITVTPVTAPTLTASKATVTKGETVKLTASGCNGEVIWSNGMTGSEILVAPQASASYTAICKKGVCTSTTSIAVVVNVTDTKPVVVANTDAAATTQGVKVNISLLANDKAADGTSASLTNVTLPVVVANPTNGTVTIKADGTADYTPNAGFTGTDSFTYKICDKTDATNCSTTTVTITVSGSMAMLVANTDAATTTQGVKVNISLLGNDKAKDGSVADLTKVTLPVVVASPTNGTVTIKADGTADYTPNTGFTGTDTFTYKICDKADPTNCSTTTVTITVSGSNPTLCTVPSATPAVSASQSSIVVGSSAVLSASGCVGGTVTWSNGTTGASITVSPTITTSYTATCKVGDCPASPASVPVTVTVSPRPIDPTACASPVVSGGTSICNGGSAVLTAAGCEGGVITWSNGMTGASITVSPASSTTYTASCKKADCTGSAASNGATVTVNTANPPTVVCSATAICKGGSVAISANGCAGTVTWNNGQLGASINVSPETSTTYTAKCKVGNCESAASANCVITVTTPAAPTIKSSASKVCYGSPVTLSADGICNGYFTWSNGLVGNAITVIPTATTSYTATCCTNANCKSAPSNSVNVEVGVSIAKPEVKNLSNACPFKKVDLTQGITSVTPSGFVVEFHVANNVTSALVANPTAIEVTGTYYAFYRSSNGCGSEGAAINVMISACTDTPDCEKNPATSNAGPSGAICAALTYKLSGQIGGAATSATWTTNGGGTFSNAMALNATYYPTIAEIVRGSTVLTLTTNDPDGAGACKAAVSTLTLTFEGIKIRPQLVINGIAKADTLPATMNICSTDSLILEAQETGYDYKWFKDGVAVPAFNNKKRIVVRESGTYSYGLIDAKRCCSVPSARVTINIPATPSATSLTATNACPATIIDLTKSLPQTTDFAAITFKTSMSASGMIVANPAQASAGTYYVYSKSGNCSVLQSIITASLTTCGTVPPVDTTKSKPAIGVAMAVKETVKQADGSYNIAYLITVKNTGNVPLTNVQIRDSIGAQIKTPATYTVLGTPILPNGSTSSLVINSSFNGTSNLNIVGTGSTLGVGKEETIVIVYNVKPNGSTTPVAGNVVASGTAGAVEVKDVSNTGTTVNPPSSTPTTVRFDLPASLMGLAKSVGAVESLGNNKYKIPYTIKVSNVGTIDLKKVQVMDDLALTFGSKAIVVGKPIVLADSGFVVDTNYTGQGMMTKLLIDSLSNLSKGTSRTVRLLVTIAATNVDSSTVFNNIAIGKAMAGTVAVTDSSTTGSNVDPDNDLDPRNNSKPTPVVLNSLPGKGLIGAALSIRDTIVQGDGSMNITYRVRIKNYGSKLVTNVQLKDSLSTVFNVLTGATFKVINTPTANDSSELRINPDFDGVKDMNLLIAEQSRLSAGKLDSVFFTVNVKTDGRLTPYLNRVCARAVSGKDTLIDLSMNGLDADPNGNNNPTELTEAEPTPVVIRAEGGELFVPEGFSPNGDGINDKFTIRHPAGTKIVIEVYNRWMHQVYRSDDYQNDWDGTSNVGGQTSQGLPVGTYYYNVVMQDANGVESKRVVRFMTINR